ncbi:MAG: hypothetical protein ACO22Q_12435 [Burkholderiales bacterium]
MFQRKCPASVFRYLGGGLLSITAYSHHAQPKPPVFDEEKSRQQSIYHAREEARLEGYVIDRGLAAYAPALMPDFEQAVERLGPTDRWLDIGAGRGQAMIDYHTPPVETEEINPAPTRPRASTVAMSNEDRRTEAWHRMADGLRLNQFRKSRCCRYNRQTQKKIDGAKPRDPGPSI